ARAAVNATGPALHRAADAHRTAAVSPHSVAGVVVMAPNLLDLSELGAVETNGTVTFGLWLPWVSAADGNAVTVKIIHESDQFLQDMPPREFPLTHRQRAPYGDFWSG